MKGGKSEKIKETPRWLMRILTEGGKAGSKEIIDRRSGEKGKGECAKSRMEREKRLKRFVVWPEKWGGKKCGAGERSNRGKG